MEVFRLLNDIQHNEARRVVYGDYSNASYEILLQNKDFNELMRLSVTIVRTDFNEIATLILHDIVDPNLFVEEYWWIIVKVWYKIENEIMQRRGDRGPSNYMINLENLKNRAEKYAKRYRSKDLEKLKKQN